MSPWRVGLAVTIGVALLLSSGPVQGAQQFAGLCALVKIEILQELTLERIGFLATLEVTNNEGDASITAFSANLTFENPNGTDASDKFFVQPPHLSGISALDGTGIIQPGQTARIEWFIIPKISAGGSEPAGERYNVGAQLGGKIYEEDIAPDVLVVLPDTISVLPEPQLEITYFQPRDVDGDDPFTSEVESAIPFTLGVLVKNAGYGRARNVQIASQQPRIVENQQALPLIAQLLGSRVDDEPTNQSTLTLDLGTIEAGKCRKGAWDMITTISGQFIEFKASYTHAPEFGGRDTSLITALNAYFIAHEVLNDQPGRDNLKDFLADTIPDETEDDIRARDIIPDTLFESDCVTLPVNRITDAQAGSYDGISTIVSANANVENWVYIRVDDPAQAKRQISSVVRSDGKVLNPNNYWTNTRYRFEDNARLDYLHIFDFVALGEYQYTVTYAAPVLDITPPVTHLRFAGEVTEVAGSFFIRPETQMYFTVEDVSPVSIFYRFSGDPSFLPGLPFSISEPGQYLVEYYSVDSAANEGTHEFATLVLSDGFPDVANLSADTSELFQAGDSVSVRPTTVTVSFEGGNPAVQTDAMVEVYRGVYGYPTLSGLPSSPTTRTTATLTVAGENVDFYRYRLNAGTWSAEYPVSVPIVLGPLSGSVALAVNGRSQLGDYLPDALAFAVTWTVSPAANPANPLGPSTPNRSTAASITVPGSPYYCYRVDGGAYVPEAAGGAPIELTDLEEGPHVVEVLERTGAAAPCPGNVPGNGVNWTVDRSYGFDLPPGAKVRSESFPDIGSTTVQFVWDGLDDAGAVVPADWYSVKITLTDALARSSSALQILHIGDVLSTGTTIPSVPGVEQKEPHAAGKWLVWQDQGNGNWDVLALDLTDGAAVPVPVTSNAFNQERPRTDGTYVVWEDRQPDGTWDVRGRRLGSADPEFPVTVTPSHDERKPTIDWPWVVFQRKPVANPGSPWQLAVHNLVTAQTVEVDLTGQDQLDPVVQAGRVVWQDLRDAGPGEIYLKDLETGTVRRITNHPAGQIQPTISDPWIVWADNRSGLQLDLYGFNLERGVEVQITATPQNEARPQLNGPWLVFTDDSTGAQNQNLRLTHMSNFATVQLTNRVSPKDRPSTAAGRLAWVDRATGKDKVMVAALPDLQPVFDNQNSVVVTADMASYQVDAFTLLASWHPEAGVTKITKFSSLVPVPIAEAAVWQGDQPSGVNFMLEPGSFLWIEFDSERILELGNAPCAPIDLAIGVNALGFSCFPDRYSSYLFFRELGQANVNSIRVLDAESGKWVAVSALAGGFVGEDFAIPRVAVVLIDMNAPVSQWTPGQEAP